MASTSSESSLNSYYSSDDEFEGGTVSFPGVIQPYQFEPDPSSDEVDEEVAVDHGTGEDSRLNNLDWCSCENCQIMDRSVECKCCQEIDAVKAKLYEAVEVEELDEPPSCITQHPGFQAVCLNYWVLQTSWHQYKQQYDEPYEGPEHKKNRHIAYRQLARWCWGFLGRHVRVVLPSCAVSCIRAHFPPPGDEEYFQFEGFRYDDE